MTRELVKERFDLGFVFRGIRVHQSRETCQQSIDRAAKAGSGELIGSSPQSQPSWDILPLAVPSLLNPHRVSSTDNQVLNYQTLIYKITEGNH